MPGKTKQKKTVDGCTRRMDGWVKGYKGQVDQWLSGWIDGEMDGWIDDEWVMNKWTGK